MTAADPFVTAAWLADHPEAIVADCRWYLDGTPALPIYEAGHLPGAHFIDLDADLSAPLGSAGRHPLPDPATFSAGMQRIGVHPDSVVVAYDDTGGVTAGRMWWMLDSVGVETYVLVGGIGAYPGELAVGPDDPPGGGTLVVDQWPAGRFVAIDTVAELSAAHPSGAGPVIIDARSGERFGGVENPVDPRFGHIPGAMSAPATANLSDGHPLPADALAEHYEAIGIDVRSEVVAYCGSGVSACLNLLALRRMGVTNTRLYTGSWSEWGADHARPLATGDT